MNSQTSRFTSRSLAIHTITAFAFLALAGTAANAQSAYDMSVSLAASDVPSITVNYKDLNLATTEGNRVLYRRIVLAAAKVCPPATATGSLMASRNRGCVDDAIARAVAATKSAQLAELQAAHGHMVRS